MLTKIDNRIPLTLLRHCEAVAFITIVKAGLFMLAGNMGGGCIICKVPDETSERGWRWSGPSSLGVGGLGGGFVFGGEKVSIYIPLMIYLIYTCTFVSSNVLLMILQYCRLTVLFC